MAQRKLLIRDFLDKDEHAHVGRTSFTRSGIVPGHRHDFHEMFWVESGAGFHLINGKTRELTPGSIHFVRPSDFHYFRSDPDQPLTIMNVAFRSQTVSDLKKRYGAELTPWPWSVRAGADGTESAESHVDVALLSAWAEELASKTRSRFSLDRFLMDVLLHIQRERASSRRAPDSQWPGWLHLAVRRFAAPEHLQSGVQGLAGLAGKSAEHLNRTLRRCSDVTATEVVNRVRLQWASRELRLTNRSVTEIGMAAGFSNIGHFIRLFKAQVGQTPQRYRRRQLLAVPV